MGSFTREGAPQRGLGMDEPRHTGTGAAALDHPPWVLLLPCLGSRLNKNLDSKPWVCVCVYPGCTDGTLGLQGLGAGLMQAWGSHAHHTYALLKSTRAIRGGEVTDHSTPLVHALNPASFFHFCRQQSAQS